MRQLPQRLSSLPVAWLMAFRPDQGIDAVQEAKQEMITAGAEHVRLGPLIGTRWRRLRLTFLGPSPTTNSYRG